jgi:hypothetical protein
MRSLLVEQGAWKLAGSALCSGVEDREQDAGQGYWPSFAPIAPAPCTTPVARTATKLSINVVQYFVSTPRPRASAEVPREPRAKLGAHSPTNGHG